MAYANDSIFVVDCSAGVPNTGMPGCEGLTLGDVAAIHFMDMSVTFPAASITDKAALLTAIKNACIATVPRERVYPIKHIAGILSNDTEATKYEKTSSGYVFKGAEGIPDITFRLLDKGLKYHNHLAKFNGRQNIGTIIEYRNGTLQAGRNSSGDIIPQRLSLISFEAPMLKTDGNQPDYKLKLVCSQVDYHQYSRLGERSKGSNTA